MPANTTEIEKRLWDAADELRANSKLKSSEYSMPVLGLIFLRYADHKFAQAEKELAGTSSRPTHDRQGRLSGARRVVSATEARFANLLKLPEGANIGQAINDGDEGHRGGERRPARGAAAELHRVRQQPAGLAAEDAQLRSAQDVEGDVFGQIYEYFLGKFAMSEGQKGGEFFTPTVAGQADRGNHRAVSWPYLRSGLRLGRHVRAERRLRASGTTSRIPARDRAVRAGEGGRDGAPVPHESGRARLGGDITQGNYLLRRPARRVGKFDYVMANPPFNVDKVDKERLKNDPRFPLGLPTIDNANYLWIQIFYSALNATGRAGFVMANSASDARGSELEMRRQLIEAGAVDVMIAIGPNLFYTVTLPCTLWFLDRGKALTSSPSPKKG